MLEVVCGLQGIGRKVLKMFVKILSYLKKSWGKMRYNFVNPLEWNDTGTMS